MGFCRTSSKFNFFPEHPLKMICNYFSNIYSLVHTGMQSCIFSRILRATRQLHHHAKGFSFILIEQNSLYNSILGILSKLSKQTYVRIVIYNVMFFINIMIYCRSGVTYIHETTDGSLFRGRRILGLLRSACCHPTSNVV